MEEELETVEVGKTFLFLRHEGAREAVGEAGGGVGEDAVAGRGGFWRGIFVHGGVGGLKGVCMELGMMMGISGAGRAFVWIEVVRGVGGGYLEGDVGGVRVRALCVERVMSWVVVHRCAGG